LDLVNERPEEGVLDPRNAGVQNADDLSPHLCSGSETGVIDR
jgi:hypothetical protein